MIWDVQEDGSLLVTETVVFRFEGGPFTYVYRELPLDFTDGIADIRATLDGVALSVGEGVGQFELSGRDPIKVTWHFDPISDAVHTYGLSYRVAGVVRQQADADLLRWHALPTDTDYTIAEATLTVNYPSGVELAAAPEVERGQAQVSAEPGRILFAARQLRSNSDLLVAVRFAPGSLIVEPPQWQVRAAQVRAGAPAWGSAAAGMLLAGLAALWVSGARWRGKGSRPAASTFHPFEPPDDLAPAIAGVLTASGGQISWQHGLATLFNLAQRGVLRIDEVERKWYRSRDFAVSLVARPSDLQLHEQGLLELLFATGKGATETVNLWSCQVA